VEHRWQKRRSLAVDVAVHFGDQILSGCRTRNVSIEGAFVDMGGMRLPKGCVVDLEVSVGNGFSAHSKLRCSMPLDDTVRSSAAPWNVSQTYDARQESDNERWRVLVHHNALPMACCFARFRAKDELILALEERHLSLGTEIAVEILPVAANHCPPARRASAVSGHKGGGLLLELVSRPVESGVRIDAHHPEQSTFAG
jgi:hypothetical protein